VLGWTRLRRSRDRTIQRLLLATNQPRRRRSPRTGFRTRRAGPPRTARSSGSRPAAGRQEADRRFAPTGVGRRPTREPPMGRSVPVSVHVPATKSQTMCRSPSAGRTFPVVSFGRSADEMGFDDLAKHISVVVGELLDRADDVVVMVRIDPATKSSRAHDRGGRDTEGAGRRPVRRLGRRRLNVAREPMKSRSAGT
jgi:hypothetical protein